MCPTLLSLLSLGESGKTQLERVMMEIGDPRTSDQVPWMRVQGAWGPSGQAISDRLFLLGFCVSLRIWAAVGESSPSLISQLSRAVGADADDTRPPHPIPQGHPSALAMSTLSHASNLDW